MSSILIDARIISTTTGRYVERILHYLEELDTTNEYIVAVRKKDENYWKPSNENFRVVVADYAPYTFSEQIGFWNFVRKQKVDLVHFCMPHEPILYRGRKITTIHDLTLLKTYNTDKNWFVYHAKQLVGRFVFRRVAHSNDRLICPTDFTKNEVVKRYHLPEAKVARTYLAAEMKTTEKKPYELPSNEFIMFVGQQSDYKNIRRLGDAHQKLLEAHPDLYLVLAGKIDQSAKRNQAYFAKKSYRNIVFTNFIDDDELNWLYANTSAYVFPSLMEGFGLPGLEAMLHKATVVSSNATCLPEVYEDAAHYFDPLNTQDMADAIEAVLVDKNLRERLIVAGTKQVARYSWKKTAEETLQVYRQVLKNSSGQ